MNLEDFNHIAGSLESIATIVALAVGGYWTYTRFVRQRENFAFIQFSVDIHVVGEHGAWWIVELVAILENKGKVQLQVKDLSFELDALGESDDLIRNERFLGQAFFPRSIASGPWIPPRTYFIEPGLTNKYTYVARVPKDVDHLMLHGHFTYINQPATHSAEKTIALPNASIRAAAQVDA